jgi:hypothetical protein
MSKRIFWDRPESVGVRDLVLFSFVAQETGLSLSEDVFILNFIHIDILHIFLLPMQFAKKVLQ